MPRILGVDIPNNKHVNVSLTYIYGIGPSVANEICRRAQIDPMLKAGDLSESNIAAILQVLQESFLVEGDLRRQVAQNIRRLIAIGSYRGLRHRRNLPARGQRTKPMPAHAREARRPSALSATNRHASRPANSRHSQCTPLRTQAIFINNKVFGA